MDVDFNPWTTIMKVITNKDKGTVKFDPLTGRINIQNSPGADFLKKAGQWTLEKGLFFHRLTENHQRKWIANFKASSQG